MASRILGMGDVLTLIEKAQSTVDEQKAMEMAKKLKEQSFDMNDLLEQMQQIKQMGSLSQVISMFPGGLQLAAVPKWKMSTVCSSSLSRCRR